MESSIPSVFFWIEQPLGRRYHDVQKSTRKRNAFHSKSSNQQITKISDMDTKYIFIAGMEKCGTTALAEWFIEERLAQYLVPGTKEPYLFAPYRFPSNIVGEVLDVISVSGGPYLDASAGYAKSGDAISKMPHHQCKILLCFRNQFERAWSSFKMKKAMALRDKRAIEIFEQHPDLKRIGGNTGIDAALKGAQMFFPRCSNHFVDKYFHEETERIKSSSFADRVKYELSFFVARGQFPFLSVLSSSFYLKPLKNILQKYQPEDVCVLTVNSLQDDLKRRMLVKAVSGIDRDSGKIRKIFSLDDAVVGAVKPDFNSAEFEPLKEIFRYDARHFLELSSSTRLGHQLLDTEEIGR